MVNPLLTAWSSESLVVFLLAATVIFYVLNTFIVSTVLGLSNRDTVGRVWQNCYFWSFPYYLVGAAIAGLVTATSHTAGWHVSLLVLPVMLLIYVSYRLHVTQAWKRQESSL